MFPLCITQINQLGNQPKHIQKSWQQIQQITTLKKKVIQRLLLKLVMTANTTNESLSPLRNPL
jgi:hypothetical protein